MWNLRVRHMQLLKVSGARLARPHLMHTFTHWRESWVNEAAFAEATHNRDKSTWLRRRCVVLEESIQRAREQDGKVAARDEEKLRVALERQRIALTGSVEERLALAEQQEKERLVEMCQQQALRRMKNRELAMAWTTWQEHYYAKARQLQLLATAGARLSRPLLVGALAHWRDDWEATEERKLRYVLTSRHTDATRRHARAKARDIFEM